VRSLYIIARTYTYTFQVPKYSLKDTSYGPAENHATSTHGHGYVTYIYARNTRLKI
jgi:hypothetical protein